MLVLGPLGPGGHEVREPVATRRQAPVDRALAGRVLDVLPGRHAALEVLADVVEVEIDRRVRSGERPTPSSARRRRARPMSRSAHRGGRASRGAGRRRGSSRPIVGPARATRTTRRGAAVGAGRLARSGKPAARVRVRAVLVRGSRRGASVGLIRKGFSPQRRGPACRSTCRPASTSRRWRPAPARSRVSAPPSPPSSASPSRGPANTPTLVTNWSQFTQTFGDFIEGSYLAHAVYGYFLNGGGAAYVVRIGADGAMPTATGQLRRARRRRTTPTLSRRRARARPGRQRDHRRGRAVRGDRREHASSSSSTRAAGPSETFDNVTTAKGKQNVVTVVKAQSKLITLEEVGSVSVVDRVPAAGSVALAGGGTSVPVRVTPDDYVGNSADRTGFAGLEAVDEVTMLSVPDLMAVYQQGNIDLEGVQAVQLAMIAHCELMGDRVAILDAPPGPQRPAGQGVAGRQGRLRLEVRDALLAVDQGLRPAVGPGDARPAERPRRRRLGAQRRHPRRPQGAGQRGHPRRDLARAQHHQGRAGPAQPGRDQLHPRVPRPRASGSGARARSRAIRRGATSTSAGSSTSSRSRSSRAPSGSSSSRTTSGSGAASSATINAFLMRVWRDGALFGATPGPGVLRQVRRGEQPARDASTRASSSSRSASRR